MKPTLERSDQVVAHVVAWHNRHPLAQRITPDQVHSVGVVSLPFAVRGARLAAVAMPEAPVATVEPPAPEPAPEAPPVELAEAPAEAAEAVVEFEPDPPADPAAALSAEPPAQPPADPPTEVPTEAAPAAAAAPPEPVAAQPSGGLTVSPPGAEEPFVTGLPGRPAELPPRPPAWHPRTWWARLRGQGAFHALFSEDFIAPWRPRRVRAWAARHGVGRRPLDAQAPQRLIVLDPARRRAGDAALEVDLHLLTAAIGVGDSRHRLLLSPDGAVLGRRRLSRPRVAAATGSTLALLAGLGGGWMWQGGRSGADGMAHHASPAASAASAVAAASAPHAVVAQAAHAAEPEASPASAATPASEAASAPNAHEAAAPADPVASAPPSVQPRRGRIDLPPLVPRLAADERHDLRSSSRELRGQPAHPPDAKAWALVTQPLADRRQSERVAAQLHAIALLQPMPMRAELMPAGAGWRAVFWPFPTAQDAEKVRLALADKGLRTEVLEF